MTPIPRIYSVLVVTESDNFIKFISALLPDHTYAPVQYVKTCTAARQQLSERAYDLVLIDTPLSDDFGNRLAVDVSTSGGQIALLLVRTDLYDGIFAKTVQHGVFCLRKPVTPQLLRMTLDYMRASRERLRKMEKKTLTVEEKIQEIRVVNRAKWILIAEQDMTEMQAHRWIEKQAMDECVTRREIAQRVIDKAEQKGQ